ncbi:hypothetical protein PVAND_015589 [Polypedilum vanderplanki]|uniref:Chitin-binding type-2 domain-containing protein n=1 Tax=Polypedilum vanderplanki TaxID=319348 RepID=A0A9J6BDB4_POLVA|nr:hypothetical protein PVAND_015589 [Polypedilum vanderplanki]
MRKLYIILILTIFQFHLQSAQQDLCAEAKAKGFIFAADPSDCSSYLYCDTVTKITHRLKCDDKYPRFHNDTCWDADLDCISCPNLNKPIKFADTKVNECKAYALCLENLVNGEQNNLGTGVCPGELHFDRNSGACVAKDLAPCESSSPPPEFKCTGRGDKYIIIPGTNCTEYAFCIDENQDPIGGWVCPPGEVFDSTKGIEKCIVKPHDFDCASMEKLMSSGLVINEKVPDHIPRARNMRS